MDQRSETSIVVKGLISADCLHRALVQFVDVDVVPPAFAGHDWWFLQAWLPPTLPEEVVLALGSAPALLLQSGGGADIGGAATVEDGVITWFVWGPLADPEAAEIPSVEMSDSFVAWSQRHAPKPLTEQTARELWDSLRGYDGHEFVRAVLEDLGWQRFGPVEEWELLGGCVRVAAPSTQFPFVGEQKMDWQRVRFVVGHGSDFIGIWDREAPAEPLRRWPSSGEGLEAAREFQRHEVDDEIIATTVLNGERAWLDLPSSHLAPAAFVHLAPAGHASLFLATDPPRTLYVSSRGFIRTNAVVATHMGFMDKMSAEIVDIPIRGIEDAQALTGWHLIGQELGTWRPVPSEVPRSLVETAKWVAREALRLNSTGQ